MNVTRRKAALFFFACVSSATAAAADDAAIGSRPGVSLGGRAAYFRAKDADHGDLSGGAQLRIHLSSVLALEGSADERQAKFGGDTFDVLPVQASLLIYLFPGYRLTPYLLGGGGWYYTHDRTAKKTQNRFGPHAGGGLELFLDRRWSVDGSYRYLWNEAVHSQDAEHPLGRDFSDRGYMFTIALNYFF